MKKFILAFLIINIFAPISYAKDFTFITSTPFDFRFSSSTEICKGYNDGYQCPGKDPVYYKNFKDFFALLHVKETYSVNNTIGSFGLNAMSGYKINDEYIYTAMIIRKKKGLLVKDKNGYEKICKVEKQGYTCNEQNEKKLFELLLPSVPWHFSFGKDGLTFLPLKITKKDCLGYDDGYQCPGEDPVYIEYFWARFLPNVSYNDGFIKSPTEPNNLCYELKNGYLCPGDLPVMDNRNELFYKYDEHKGIFISDKDNPKDTKICRYYDNFKTYSDIGYECNGEKVVILKKRPTTINYKGSKKWGTESQMRTDIISKRYKIIECSQFVNGYTYCPGEEDSPSYGTFPLQPGDKPTPSPFPKTKTIYDYQNGKYYTLIEEPNGNYTIKPGQGWIR